MADSVGGAEASHGRGPSRRAPDPTVAVEPIIVHERLVELLDPLAMDGGPDVRRD